MNGALVAALCGFFCYFCTSILSGSETMRGKEKIVNNSTRSISASAVQRLELANGMTILVQEVRTVPKVSVQIWYDVGSKDELSGEKGIAHLIEHMIFKGTNTLLSESDINAIAQKLSAHTNAFTSYDYTGYMFTLPSNQWYEILPIMKDFMLNAAFDDEMLSSEMKAVIQEMKLGKDSYHRTVLESLLSMIFADHPYHYPIIGYKHDLWTVRGPDLKDFYERHYAPNNATLIVVGDVSAADVFARAKDFFGKMAPKKNPSTCYSRCNGGYCCKDGDLISRY